MVVKQDFSVFGGDYAASFHCILRDRCKNFDKLFRSLKTPHKYHTRATDSSVWRRPT